VQASGAEIALETLDRAEAGDLAGARQWLDWAREILGPVGGDDPLGRPVFPRFWTKGSEAGVEQIRLAAAVLLADSGGPAAKRGEEILRKARAEATEERRIRDLTLALALLARATEKYEELVSLSSELIAAYPDSDGAFQLQQLGLFRLRRFEEARRTSRESLARRPDRTVALQTLATVAMQEGDYVGAEKWSAALEEKGKALAMDRNNRAWNLLYLDPVDEKALELARKATDTEPKRPEALHTLATVYAELGQCVQAREALLESMRRAGRDEPESHDWYVLGRIAEQYGELEAAIQSYRKVEKEEGAPGNSVYVLAQRRLSALLAAAKAPARTNF
jgi:tetratricopeptide (TPR) repeat protein